MRKVHSFFDDNEMYLMMGWMSGLVCPLVSPSTWMDWDGGPIEAPEKCIKSCCHIPLVLKYMARRNVRNL